MRIFQTSPKLSSVSRWNWSRLPRWKAPSLWRWREPLLFTPYRLMPTCAVVPDGCDTAALILSIIYSWRFHEYMKMHIFLKFYAFLLLHCADLSLADLLLAAGQSWPALCSGTAQDGHTGGPGSVSNCPSGPVYVRWAPPAGESEPGQHTQSPPPCYAWDRLTAQITHGWREHGSLSSFESWLCIWEMDYRYSFDKTIKNMH